MQYCGMTLIGVWHCFFRCTCEHLLVLHYWTFCFDRQTLFEGFVCDPKINRGGRTWEVEALDYQRDSIELFKYNLPSVKNRVAVHIHALNKKIAKDPRVLVNILPTGSGLTIVTKLWLGSSGSLSGTMIILLPLDFLRVSHKIPGKNKNAVYRLQISALVLEIFKSTSFPGSLSHQAVRWETLGTRLYLSLENV